MLKTIKPAIYLAAVILIAAVAALALIRSGSKQPAPANKAQSFHPIDGAQAYSYEPADGITEISSSDLLIGSNEAKLKIFVYEDYANVFSAELAETLDQLKSEHQTEIALIVRPFVLPGSWESQEAAKVFLCAQEEGRGGDARQHLLASAKNGGLNEEALTALINDLRINEQKFSACLTNPDKSVKLEEAMQAARRQLIIGAPTLLVGDELIFGARPYADFIDSNGDAIEGLKTVIVRKLN